MDHKREIAELKANQRLPDQINSLRTSTPVKNEEFMAIVKDNQGI